jgi:hypothetical protein
MAYVSDTSCRHGVVSRKTQGCLVHTVGQSEFHLSAIRTVVPVPGTRCGLGLGGHVNVVRCHFLFSVAYKVDRIPNSTYACSHGANQSANHTHTLPTSVSFVRPSHAARGPLPCACCQRNQGGDSKPPPPLQRPLLPPNPSSNTQELHPLLPFGLRSIPPPPPPG